MLQFIYCSFSLNPSVQLYDFYYTHQHVCANVSSDETDDRMTYYIHQSRMAAPHYVSSDASSDYPDH
jgi:hypothetical protein